LPDVIVRGANVAGAIVRGAIVPATTVGATVRGVNLFTAAVPAAGNVFSLRTRGVRTLMFELQIEREEHRP